ncbi:hypothetical protein [Flavobacterium sp.]|jgi:hypothetical protein|uniref:hypothetical protein n=1 Tax=Flavobacterium sp. TaxID=239 RepID=UPI0037BF3BDC
MSDILIPMAADRRLDVGFDAMDSQIEYARTCCATMGCLGDCDQGRKDCRHPMPAEACTEVGADADEQMRSADSIGFIYIAVGAICWACFLVWAIAGGPNA